MPTTDKVKPDTASEVTLVADKCHGESSEESSSQRSMLDSCMNGRKRLTGGREQPQKSAGYKAQGLK